MATDQQGIMSLPADDQMGMPPDMPAEQMGGNAPMSLKDAGLSRADAFDGTRVALAQVDPGAAQEMDQLLAQMAAELAGVPEDDLQMILEMIQYLEENEEGYPELRKNLISQGIFDAEDLPEEYDPEFLAVMEMVVQEALTAVAPQELGMEPPPGFAQGGIADAARQVAGAGRNGDTMLAHITPAEADMLKSMGGSGTINPETGLPEYFVKWVAKKLGGAVKSVAKVVKNVLKSPIGKIAGTVALTALGGWALPALGVSSTLAAPLASAATTLLGGGSVKDALISGAVGYFGGANSPLAKYTQPLAEGLGITSNVGLGAVNMGLASAAGGLLSGKGLKGAIQEGLTGAAIGAGTTYLNQGYTPVQGGPNSTLAGHPMGGTAARYGTTSGGAAPGTAAGQGGGGMWDSFTGMFKDDQGNYSPWKLGLGAAGAMALAGGFKQEDLPQSEFQQEMTTGPDMPRNLTWGVQNMRGVKYNPDGSFADVQEPWNPYDYPAPRAPQTSIYDPSVVAPAPSYPVPGNIPFSNTLSIPQPYNTAAAYTNLLPPPAMQPGGIAQLAEGGYPRRIGAISGPGTSTSDSIPAMLSDGEFVMTADAVRGAGNGNREEGARRMYQMMHQLEQNA